MARALFTTHGMSKTPIYRTWCAMRCRCFDFCCKNYFNYGGRGITVCDRWLTFENFFEDMGPRPPGLQLERKDNDGNYEPGNCIWADRVQQANNKRNNRHITSHGLTMTLAQWARHKGLPMTRVHNRLNQLGWPVWKALGFEEQG
jgi:hypothetical protein